MALSLKYPKILEELMPNFLFEFEDTTIQQVQTTIEAEDQEEAQFKFDQGNWEARIKHEYVESRDIQDITEVGPAQQVAWKNPLVVPHE